jgi:hypothetical protein
MTVGAARLYLHNKGALPRHHRRRDSRRRVPLRHPSTGVEQVQTELRKRSILGCEAVSYVLCLIRTSHCERSFSRCSFLARSFSRRSSRLSVASLEEADSLSALVLHRLLAFGGSSRITMGLTQTQTLHLAILNTFFSASSHLRDGLPFCQVKLVPYLAQVNFSVVRENYPEENRLSLI